MIQLQQKYELQICMKYFIFQIPKKKQPLNSSWPPWCPAEVDFDEWTVKGIRYSITAVNWKSPEKNAWDHGLVNGDEELCWSQFRYM